MLVNNLSSFELAPGLIALGRIEPVAQSSIDSSDFLECRAILYLPCAERNGDWPPMDDRIVFGTRLAAFGEKLKASWGTAIAEFEGRRFRKRSELFYGDTWLEAIAEAEDYLLYEVAKLRAWLERRAAKLRSEGEEHYLATALVGTQKPEPWTGRYPEVLEKDMKESK